MHTVTMLDTIVMICVMFSFGVGEGVGLRMPDSSKWRTRSIPFEPRGMA